MKRSLLGTGFLTLALLTGSAFADHGRDHDRDHDGGHKRDRQHVQHVADHDRRPPGWDHGQKRGWGDHNMPPGQAKKHEAWERHEARESREHEWRERQHARRAHEALEAREARERRAAEWRKRREARERHMADWRERERRERERRAEWRRRHPRSGTWARGPVNSGTPTTTTTTTTTSGPVATTNRPNLPPVITPSGRRLPSQPQNQ